MATEISLSSKKYPGLVALVDDEDAELVAGYTWHPVKHNKNGTFYARAYVPHSGRKSARNVYMHHLIRPDIAGQADHADRDGLNNQRANLRPASASQQLTNQGISSRNTSGYKGVCFDKRYGKWRADIQVNGTGTHLGHFDLPEDAARVYDAAARELHGEFAGYLNFPDETVNVGVRVHYRTIVGNNTSGYRGVSWDAARDKWIAAVRAEGKQRHLGRFDDPIEAARAYDVAAIEMHGGRARLNFPHND